MVKIKQRVPVRPRVPKPHRQWFKAHEKKYSRQYVSNKLIAKNRNEEWELTIQDYIDIWGDLIDQRGRITGCYKMIRIFKSKPWRKDNVMLVQLGIKREYL